MSNANRNTNRKANQPPSFGDRLLEQLWLAGQWHPIETAPKPTTEWFTADLWAVSSVVGGRRYPDSTLHENGEWYDNGGNKLNWSALDADGEPQYRKVTHWMPLPQPPKLPPTPEEQAAKDADLARRLDEDIWANNERLARIKREKS